MLGEAPWAKTAAASVPSTSSTVQIVSSICSSTEMASALRIVAIGASLAISSSTAAWARSTASAWSRWFTSRTPIRMPATASSSVRSLARAS